MRTCSPATTRSSPRCSTLIDRLPPERLDEEFAGSARDRNVRDVVAHLHAWHILLERWYSDGMTGGSPSIPAEATRGGELAELNEDLGSSGRTRAWPS